MKNLFFFFLVLILSAGTIAFGQVSDTEIIMNAIRKAAPINREYSGIENPNVIYPGQTVWVPVEVKKGDTQWYLYRDMLYPVVREELQEGKSVLPQVIKSVVRYSESEPVTHESKNESMILFLSNLGNFLLKLFLGVVVVCVLFIILYALYREFKNKKEQKSMKEEIQFSSDPASEGPAFVEGGVHTDQKEEVINKDNKQKPVEKKELQSDEVMIVNDHAMATVEFLKTQRAHRVTINYQKNADGSVSIKSIFKTKNPTGTVKEGTKK